MFTFNSFRNTLGLRLQGLVSLTIINLEKNVLFEIANNHR